MSGNVRWGARISGGRESVLPLHEYEGGGVFTQR